MPRMRPILRKSHETNVHLRIATSQSLSSRFDKSAAIANANGMVMVFHPPMLYLGYISITIPFAFAIAALLSKRLDSDWLVAIRKWTLVSWLFLSIGLILGMWWAYVELGWGGYWAWDPVQNAALLPWLVMTAFLH